jgi:hypothetical protein
MLPLYLLQMTIWGVPEGISDALMLADKTIEGVYQPV